MFRSRRIASRDIRNSSLRRAVSTSSTFVEVAPLHRVVMLLRRALRLRRARAVLFRTGVARLYRIFGNLLRLLLTWRSIKSNLFCQKKWYLYDSRPRGRGLGLWRGSCEQSVSAPGSNRSKFRLTAQAATSCCTNIDCSLRNCAAKMSKVNFLGTRGI